MTVLKKESCRSHYYGIAQTTCRLTISSIGYYSLLFSPVPLLKIITLHFLLFCFIFLIIVSLSFSENRLVDSLTLYSRRRPYSNLMHCCRHITGEIGLEKGLLRKSCCLRDVDLMVREWQVHALSAAALVQGKEHTVSPILCNIKNPFIETKYIDLNWSFWSKWRLQYCK